MAPATILDQALIASAETSQWDFKQSFDPTSDPEWIELLKDILALSNSGGGLILFEVLDNGFPVGCDADALLAVDPAIVTDKAFKYSGVHLDTFRLVRCKKDTVDLCALLAGSAEYPIAFQRVGTYSVGDGKQKTAFSQGTVYFRHGAKSEPAVTEDFRIFFERKTERLREGWLRNMKAVLDSPPESVFAVLPSVVRLSNAPDAQPIRITSEQAAQLLQAPMEDHTHPLRQKEALCEINRRLDPQMQLNSHDLLCIRRARNIQRDLKYCYNMNWNSPRYSLAFVEWVVSEVKDDATFVQQCRDAAKTARNEGPAGEPK